MVERRIFTRGRLLVSEVTAIVSSVTGLFEHDITLVPGQVSYNSCEISMRKLFVLNDINKPK